MPTESAAPVEVTTPPTVFPVTTAGSLDEGPNDAPRSAPPDDSFDVEPPYRPERDDLPPDRFLDRELSWLAFNARVLELAEDPDLPLLERARFLAIFASNLDEFFMVRVAGLKRRIATGLAVACGERPMPREVLESIWRQSSDLMERHAARASPSRSCRAVSEHGINLLRWDELDADEQEQLTSSSPSGSSRC